MYGYYKIFIKKNKKMTESKVLIFNSPKLF